MTFGLLPVMTTHQQLIQLSTKVSFMATTTSDDYELNTFHQNQADIDSHIRLFWDDFPCPPPWRPSILTEVNMSKLGPQIGQSVKKFLVGKCQLQSVFPSIQLDPEWSEDEFDIPDPLGGGGRGGGGSHATSTTSSRDHSWCDQTCQLAIGCSGVFVAIVIVLIAIVCFNRSRRSHKMPSTRPSRQQLQMSTSTSDPVNWAEFSNTQVQFDDDMIYPPFRHRDLPSPPNHCHHPSCDPKWNCPNGSSFHPLMRVSPATTTYYTRGYTAVYEKIDDEDDEYYDDRVPCNHTRPIRQGDRTVGIPQIGYRPANGIPFIPESHANAARYREDETGFNGENFPVSILPRYFELQDTHHNPNNTINSTREDQLNVANNAHRANDSTRSPRTTNTNNSCCNSFQLQNAFVNNTNNGCNQLCATCVSNVVSTNSPPAGINNHSHRQHEPSVSNVNSFSSTNPIISSTVNGMSTLTHISGYHPPNTSSFRQLPHTSAESPPFFNDSVPTNNPPPYSDHGCDLRYRSSSRTHDEDPLYENDNNDEGSPFTEITGTQTNKHNTGSHSRACHMAHNTASPIGSPCRDWCPSCQQVPLLQGNNASEHPHSACSAWPNNHNNLPPQHTKTQRRTRFSDDTVPANSDKEDAENRRADPKEENGDIRFLDGYTHHVRDQTHMVGSRNGEDNTGDACGTQEKHTTDKNHCRIGRDEEDDCDEELSQQVLSLHTHYFNKQS